MRLENKIIDELVMEKYDGNIISLLLTDPNEILETLNEKRDLNKLLKWKILHNIQEMISKIYVKICLFEEKEKWCIAKLNYIDNIQMEYERIIHRIYETFTYKELEKHNKEYIKMTGVAYS